MRHFKKQLRHFHDPARGSITMAVEALEKRLQFNALFATAGEYHSTVLINRDYAGGDVEADATGNPGPSASALSPARMVGGYGADNINFDGVVGDGTGQTIAIIDWFDDPKLVNSTSMSFGSSDLALFDAQFGLPDPVFTKYGVTSGGVVAPMAYPAAGNSLETALDVEWAHVMAPKANIVLIEASSNSSTNVNRAIAAADALAGVNVVSMSFGSAESGQVNASVENTYNSTYFSKAGITYVASSGDNGIYAKDVNAVSPIFPGASVNVLSVGGTTLSVSNANSWLSETVWGNGSNSYMTSAGGGGGGGESLYASRPTYQNGFSTASKRAYPDISMEGNPNPGVPVLDSNDYGVGTGWVTVGGTSLSAPLMAGLVAIADQGRALASLPTLNSNGVGSGIDIHTLIYNLAGNATSYAADFHDVTLGNNGIAAGTGYDEASGLGSPIANNLVYDLSGISATLAVNQPSLTNLYFKRDANPLKLDVWVNSLTPGSGVVTHVYVLAFASAAKYIGGLGNDVLTLDYSAGDFAAGLSGITYNGTAAGNNTVNFLGTSSGDTISVATGSIAPSGGLGATLIAISNVQNVSFPGGSGGSDSVLVTSSPVAGFNINADTATGTPNVSVGLSGASTVVNFLASQHLAGLTIGATDTAVLGLSALSGGKVLVTGSLSDSGALDLMNNVAIIHNGILATISGLIGNGFAAGTGYWNGQGIRSTSAAGDTRFLTALGIRQGDGNPFDGEPTFAYDVLVKYAYYGDADLSGTLNGADYQQIDLGFGSGATDWAHGNFNYDAAVDGSDFSLLDNTLNQIAATSANPLALVATTAAMTQTSYTVANSLPETKTRKVWADDLLIQPTSVE